MQPRQRPGRILQRHRTVDNLRNVWDGSGSNQQRKNNNQLFSWDDEFWNRSSRKGLNSLVSPASTFEEVESLCFSKSSSDSMGSTQRQWEKFNSGGQWNGPSSSRRLISRQSSTTSTSTSRSSGLGGDTGRTEAVSEMSAENRQSITDTLLESMEFLGSHGNLDFADRFYLETIFQRVLDWNNGLLSSSTDGDQNYGRHNGAAKTSQRSPVHQDGLRNVDSSRSHAALRDKLENLKQINQSQPNRSIKPGMVPDHQSQIDRKKRRDLILPEDDDIDINSRSCFQLSRSRGRPTGINREISLSSRDTSTSSKGLSHSNSVSQQSHLSSMSSVSMENGSLRGSAHDNNTAQRSANPARLATLLPQFSSIPAGSFESTAAPADPYLMSQPYTTGHAERVLMGLGFGAADGFLPERFLKDWYTKISKAQVGSKMAPPPEFRSQASCEIPGNAQHQTIHRQFSPKTERASHNGGPTSQTFRDSHSSPRRHEARNMLPPSNYKDSKLERLKEYISAYSNNMSIDDEREVKIKQFAMSRQKSLPLCLETITKVAEDGTKLLGLDPFDKEARLQMFISGATSGSETGSNSDISCKSRKHPDRDNVTSSSSRKPETNNRQLRRQQHTHNYNFNETSENRTSELKHDPSINAQAKRMNTRPEHHTAKQQTSPSSSSNNKKTVHEIDKSGSRTKSPEADHFVKKSHSGQANPDTNKLNYRDERNDTVIQSNIERARLDNTPGRNAQKGQHYSNVNQRQLNNRDSTISKDSLEVADIMQNQSKKDQHCSAANQRQVANGKGPALKSALKHVEPAMVSIVLEDIDENEGRCSADLLSVTQEGVHLVIPLSALSPIPQSPITVIEVSLDNQHDSLDTEGTYSSKEADDDNHLSIYPDDYGVSKHRGGRRSSLCNLSPRPEQPQRRRSTGIMSPIPCQLSLTKMPSVTKDGMSRRRLSLEVPVLPELRHLLEKKKLLHPNQSRDGSVDPKKSREKRRASFSEAEPTIINDVLVSERNISPVLGKQFSSTHEGFDNVDDHRVNEVIHEPQRSKSPWTVSGDFDSSDNQYSESATCETVPLATEERELTSNNSLCSSGNNSKLDAESTSLTATKTPNNDFIPRIISEPASDFNIGGSKSVESSPGSTRSAFRSTGRRTMENSPTTCNGYFSETDAEEFPINVNVNLMPRPISSIAKNLDDENTDTENEISSHVPEIISTSLRDSPSSPTLQFSNTHRLMSIHGYNIHHKAKAKLISRAVQVNDSTIPCSISKPIISRSNSSDYYYASDKSAQCDLLGPSHQSAVQHVRQSLINKFSQTDVCSYEVSCQTTDNFYFVTDDCQIPNKTDKTKTKAVNTVVCLIGREHANEYAQRSISIKSSTNSNIIDETIQEIDDELSYIDNKKYQRSLRNIATRLTCNSRDITRFQTMQLDGSLGKRKPHERDSLYNKRINNEMKSYVEIEDGKRFAPSTWRGATEFTNTFNTKTKENGITHERSLDTTTQKILHQHFDTVGKLNSSHFSYNSAVRGSVSEHHEQVQRILKGNKKVITPDHRTKCHFFDFAKDTPTNKDNTRGLEQARNKILTTSLSDQNQPQWKATSLSEQNQPQWKATSLSEQNQPQWKATSVSDQSHPQWKATSMSEQNQPQRKATSLSEQNQPQRKATSLSEQSHPQWKATSLSEQNQPQRKATSLSEQSHPQWKATSLSEQSQPQWKATSVSEQSHPQWKATSVSDQSHPQWKATSVSEQSHPQWKATSVSDQSHPQWKATSVSEQSQPQRKATSLSEQSQPQWKVNTLQNNAFNHVTQNSKQIFGRRYSFSTCTPTKDARNLDYFFNYSTKDSNTSKKAKSCYQKRRTKPYGQSVRLTKLQKHANSETNPRNRNDVLVGNKLANVEIVTSTSVQSSSSDSHVTSSLAAGNEHADRGHSKLARLKYKQSSTLQGSASSLDIEVDFESAGTPVGMLSHKQQDTRGSTCLERLNHLHPDTNGSTCLERLNHSHPDTNGSTCLERLNHSRPDTNGSTCLEIGIDEITCPINHTTNIDEGNKQIKLDDTNSRMYSTTNKFQTTSKTPSHHAPPSMIISSLTPDDLNLPDQNCAANSNAITVKLAITEPYNKTEATKLDSIATQDPVYDKKDTTRTTHNNSLSSNITIEEDKPCLPINSKTKLETIENRSMPEIVISPVKSIHNDLLQLPGSPDYLFRKATFPLSVSSCSDSSSNSPLASPHLPISQITTLNYGDHERSKSSGRANKTSTFASGGDELSTTFHADKLVETQPKNKNSEVAVKTEANAGSSYSLGTFSSHSSHSSREQLLDTSSNSSIVPVFLNASHPEDCFHIDGLQLDSHFTNGTDFETAEASVKDSVKPQIQDTVKPQIQGTVKLQIQGTVQPQTQDTVKPQTHDTVKPQIHDTVKPQIHDIVKPQINDTVKPQMHDTVKPQIQDTVKPQIQNTVKPQIQDTVKPQIQETVSDILLLNESLHGCQPFTSCPASVDIFENDDIDSNQSEAGSNENQDIDDMEVLVEESRKLRMDSDSSYSEAVLDMSDSLSESSLSGEINKVHKEYTNLLTSGNDMDDLLQVSDFGCASPTPGPTRIQPGERFLPGQGVHTQLRDEETCSSSSNRSPLRDLLLKSLKYETDTDSDDELDSESELRLREQLRQSRRGSRHSVKDSLGIGHSVQHEKNTSSKAQNKEANDTAHALIPERTIHIAELNIDDNTGDECDKEISRINLKGPIIRRLTKMYSDPVDKDLYCKSVSLNVMKANATNLENNNPIAEESPAIAYTECKKSDVLLVPADEVPSPQEKGHKLLHADAVKLFTETPLEIIETSVEMMETPLKLIEAPAKMMETPLKLIEAPAKMMKTPLKVMETPLGNAHHDSSKTGLTQTDKSERGCADIEVNPAPNNNAENLYDYFDVARVLAVEYVQDELEKGQLNSGEEDADRPFTDIMDELEVVALFNKIDNYDRTMNLFVDYSSESSSEEFKLSLISEEETQSEDTASEGSQENLWHVRNRFVVAAQNIAMKSVDGSTFSESIGNSRYEELNNTNQWSLPEAHSDTTSQEPSKKDSHEDVVANAVTDNEKTQFNFDNFYELTSKNNSPEVTYPSYTIQPNFNQSMLRFFDNRSRSNSQEDSSTWKPPSNESNNGQTQHYAGQVKTLNATGNEVKAGCEQTSPPYETHVLETRLDLAGNITTRLRSSRALRIKYFTSSKSNHEDGSVTGDNRSGSTEEQKHTSSAAIVVGDYRSPIRKSSINMPASTVETFGAPNDMSLDDTIITHDVDTVFTQEDGIEDEPSFSKTNSLEFRTDKSTAYKANNDVYNIMPDPSTQVHPGNLQEAYTENALSHAIVGSDNTGNVASNKKVGSLSKKRLQKMLQSVCLGDDEDNPTDMTNNCDTKSIIAESGTNEDIKNRVRSLFLIDAANTSAELTQLHNLSGNTVGCSIEGDLNVTEHSLDFVDAENTDLDSKERNHNGYNSQIYSIATGNSRMDNVSSTSLVYSAGTENHITNDVKVNETHCKITSPSIANNTSPAIANITSPSIANITSPSIANNTSPSIANNTSPSIANNTSPSIANNLTQQVMSMLSVHPECSDHLSKNSSTPIEAHVNTSQRGSSRQHWGSMFHTETVDSENISEDNTRSMNTSSPVCSVNQEDLKQKVRSMFLIDTLIDTANSENISEENVQSTDSSEPVYFSNQEDLKQKARSMFLIDTANSQNLSEENVQCTDSTKPASSFNQEDLKQKVRSMFLIDTANSENLSEENVQCTDSTKPASSFNQEDLKQKARSMFLIDTANSENLSEENVQCTDLTKPAPSFNQEDLKQNVRSMFLIDTTDTLDTFKESSNIVNTNCQVEESLLLNDVLPKNGFPNDTVSSMTTCSDEDNSGSADISMSTVLSFRDSVNSSDLNSTGECVGSMSVEELQGDSCKNLHSKSVDDALVIDDIKSRVMSMLRINHTSLESSNASSPDTRFHSEKIPSRPKRVKVTTMFSDSKEGVSTSFCTSVSQESDETKNYTLDDEANRFKTGGLHNIRIQMLNKGKKHISNVVDERQTRGNARVLKCRDSLLRLHEQANVYSPPGSEGDPELITALTSQGDYDMRKRDLALGRISSDNDEGEFGLSKDVYCSGASSQSQCVGGDISAAGVDSSAASLFSNNDVSSIYSENTKSSLPFNESEIAFEPTADPDPKVTIEQPGEHATATSMASTTNTYCAPQLACITENGIQIENSLECIPKPEDRRTAMARLWPKPTSSSSLWLRRYRQSNFLSPNTTVPPTSQCNDMPQREQVSRHYDDSHPELSYLDIVSKLSSQQAATDQTVPVKQHNIQVIITPPDSTTTKSVKTKSVRFSSDFNLD